MLDDLMKLSEQLGDAYEKALAPEVAIKKVTEEAIIPSFGSDGAAGFDFYSTNRVDIYPGEAKTVSTGIAMAIPEGLTLLLFSRSGLGFKNGLRLANCVGVIDSDYRGEIMAKIHNDSEYKYTVEKGERIVQGVLVPFISPKFVEVTSLDETARGEGGFGSTGKC